jgi:PTH1 family peptidyl-tRNA hydrolase
LKLIVGLGNPGPEYDRTRHNVGFDVLDRLGRRHAGGALARSRFGGLLLDAEIPRPAGSRGAGPEEGGSTVRVLLLKPLTYMNRSGQSVAEAVRFHKLDPQNDLLVMADDIALACGVIRLRERGSAGGHNGLADVERLLGTEAYGRLRIGVDPPGAIPQASYVLGQFRPDQRERLDPALEEATRAVECWSAEGLSTAMNRFNRRNTLSQA